MMMLHPTDVSPIRLLQKLFLLSIPATTKTIELMISASFVGGSNTQAENRREKGILTRSSEMLNELVCKAVINFKNILQEAFFCQNFLLPKNYTKTVSSEKGSAKQFHTKKLLV